MSAIIRVEHLPKAYRSYSKPRDRLLERLSGNRIKRHMLKYALNDVSFELFPGDRLGILGENGSGKSTLLKILSGVLSPTSGTAAVNGKVAALLELGTGFHPDLTGRENVFQNGYIMGYSDAEMQERYPEIVAFSELGEAVAYPVRSYSSGMLLRLAFACSVFVEPDILIVDEALSVGDAYFQTKCFYKIQSLIEKGTTFLYVSHGQDSVRTLCNKGIVLDEGAIRYLGEASDAADWYASRIYAKQAALAGRSGGDAVSSEAGTRAEETAGGLTGTFSRNAAFAERVEALRQGTGLARITDVRLLDAKGNPVTSLQLHQEATVQVHFESSVPLSPFFSLGMGIADENGLVILQSTLLDRNIRLYSEQTPSRHIVDFTFTNILRPGIYSIVAGMAEFMQATDTSHYIPKEVYDQCYGCCTFTAEEDTRRPVWGKVFYEFTITTQTLSS